MTRIGWVFLGLVVLLGAGLASLVRVGGPPPAATVAAQPTAAPVERTDGSPTLIVPVEGVARSAIVDTWGQARSEGREHHGTDIPAAAGARVVAAADGTIEKLFASRLGGTTLYERSADRRWTFYYAHLAGYAPGLREGQAVRAGDTIGYVGDTGDAGPGNFHLHFGLTRTTPDKRWYQGEDVNAFPSLAGKAGLR